MKIVVPVFELKLTELFLLLDQLVDPVLVLRPAYARVIPYLLEQTLVFQVYVVEF